MRQYAAWLVGQKFPYLPARDRKNRVCQYGSPEAFNALIDADITYQNGRHSEDHSLERVNLPEGVKLVPHHSDLHCALLLGVNKEQIAHVYFDKDLGSWILHTPQSNRSPLNRGARDTRELLDEAAGVVEKVGDTVAKKARGVAAKVREFARELD